jgi:ABC-2 type transport system ATP-binding protein
MTELIRALGLSKRYADRTVLDRVSFSVAAGEVVALLGPNGAGKTTTVEILEGYRRADAGRAEVLGADPAGAGREHRARVGIMLQSGGIDPRSTVAEVLRLHAAFFRDPRDPNELIQLLGLETVAAARTRTISGGERQRLSLALALVGRPDVLMLDEPTAGMDPAAKARARELIAVLRADGAAVLLTTHELPDVERLADRIVLIDRGSVVATGSPAELLTEAEPRLRFRLAPPLSAADRSAVAELVGADGRDRSSVTLVDEGVGRYALVGIAPSPELVHRLASWCAEHGVLLVELHAGGATLEERYLELTAREPAP